MNTFRRWLTVSVFLAPVLLGLAGCTTFRPYVDTADQDWAARTPPTTDLVYQTFLVGDMGGVETEGTDAVLSTLSAHLQRATEDAALIVLGDNLHCCGLPDSLSEERPPAEARLRAQLEAVAPFPGRIAFIPGNQDWNHPQPDGRARLQRQEQFVEAYLDRGNTFVPDQGFPGPHEIRLADDLVLIVLDTQWWLLPEDQRPEGDTGDYEVEEVGDVLLELEDLLRKHDDRTVIVAGHHPLRSNGRRAGFVPARTHLFPLTELNPALFIPLPVVGSLYPAFLRLRGTVQDLAHPRYVQLRQALTQVLATHERLIYASGHEHALQYFREEAATTTHHLGSGAGSQPQPIATGRGLTFGVADRGFMVIDHHADGSAWMRVYTAEEAPDGRLVFQTPLLAPFRDRLDPRVAGVEAPDIDYSDSTRVVAANPAYQGTALRRAILGRHNRKAWATPVEVPVLDLGRTAGGLTPVKRGGGQQTISLRLQGGDGYEYVLRSIDKDPSSTVPLPLQGTVATDIVQDQIASIHPYGAFIVPQLASAAGIYHTNPRLVFVPDDPRLGRYRTQFGNTLMMFEERPNDDMSAWPSSGRAEDVVSANRFYEEIDGDNDHRVDQPFFARTRLVDMLLSDWDRHRDQWRWAAFEPGELDSTLTGEAATQGKVYRPIPRDRDWAFNEMNGPPGLARLFDPKFQSFRNNYGNLKGLTLNGGSQDRRLTNELTEAQWLAEAEAVQAALTDAVIDEAVAAWPASIQALDGERVAATLKTRRDQLDEVAASYYRLLATVVDVVGSRKHERFEVTHLGEGRTRVQVIKTRRNGEPVQLFYERIFDRAETQEVRLYGLDGEDRFVVEGPAADGVRVIAVGGEGMDRFEDRSTTRGLGRARHHYYDTERGATWDVTGAGRVHASADPFVNVYNPASGFRYDAQFPLLFFGSNEDDGVFLGGGLRWVRHGFRKLPYAQQHILKANVATRTWAFNVVYEGHYVGLIDQWDARLQGRALAPNSFRNFFGLGNETEQLDVAARFYEVQLQQYALSPSLVYPLGTLGGLTVDFGTEYTRVERDADRVSAALPAANFDDQWVFSLGAGVTLAGADDPVNPRRGFRFRGEAAVHRGVRAEDASYA
ncbi:MAG: hypothetical protein AAGI71_18720, partial [Bacteroidota bacterium]